MSKALKNLLKKIDHIGIAVESLDKAMPFYTLLTGQVPDHIEVVESEKVKTAFFSVGEINLELLEATDPESAIAKYIARQGRGGIHHICVAVDDIRAKIAELKNAGLTMIHDEPKQGAHNKLVAFVHPKSAGGVLIELAQENYQIQRK